MCALAQQRELEHADNGQAPDCLWQVWYVIAGPHAASQ